MPIAQFDFYLDAWADWQRTVVMRDTSSGLAVPLTNALMEIRNTNFVLVMRLDTPSSRCVVLNDGCTIALHITEEDSLAYFAQGNYPGAIQAVGYWGIGRSYRYDLFATPTASGVQSRLMAGFFNVDPNISRPTIMPVPASLTIGERGSYVNE